MPGGKGSGLKKMGSEFREEEVRVGKRGSGLKKMGSGLFAYCLLVPGSGRKFRVAD